MPAWPAWVSRISIPSPEGSVVLSVSGEFCPRYSTTHGLAGRFLGFNVTRFDRSALPDDGSLTQGEYTQSCVAGQRIWIPLR